MARSSRFLDGLAEASDAQYLARVCAWVLILLALTIAALAFAEPPIAAAQYKREYVRIVRSEWGLDAPVAALAAQIQQESGWNCRARSRVGAAGCAQFMPATAVWIGDVNHELREGDVYSPAWAFRAQASYMEWLHARIKASDECNRMAFALAAYNGGLGYVYRRQKLSRAPGVCFDATCDINPGVSVLSQRENADYPKRILRYTEPVYATWGPGACLKGRS